MSKQISFYINIFDYYELVNEIKKQSGVVINEDGYVLSEFELHNLFDYEFRKSKYRYPYFYICHKDSKLVFKFHKSVNRNAIDIILSEAIEFQICKPKPNNPNFIEVGRLWYQSFYYDSNEQTVKKNSSLDFLYNAITKYIKKTYMLSKNKFAYIGPGFYDDYKDNKVIPVNLTQQITLE